MKPLLCEIASYPSPSSGEVQTVWPERVLLVGDPNQSQRRVEYNYVYFFLVKVISGGEKFQDGGKTRVMPVEDI